MKWQVCADGGLLCPECQHENKELIRNADQECQSDDQWRSVGLQDPTEGDQCDNCYYYAEADADYLV